MPDVYGGAKPKVPKEPKQDIMPEGNAVNEETDEASASHPRVRPQTGGKHPQPCDKLKSGKNSLPYRCGNKSCKKQPSCQDAGKTSDKKFQTSIGKRMPRNECNSTNGLNRAITQSRNLDATNVAELSVSNASLKDYNKHKSKCTKLYRNNVSKPSGQKTNRSSSDCDMDKVLDKSNDTDGTSHLLSSSSSLDSDWLQNLPVANQNTQDLLWDCDCTKVPGCKCNCDSDWTFKLPGVCDNDSEWKTVEVAQVPACTGGDRSRKPRKSKRERKSLVHSTGIKEKAETSTDDEQYELVFDQHYGEVVRRAKSREKSGPLKQVTSLPDREQTSGLARAENIRRTDRDSSSPECTLKHALPYLPARLRNRLTAGQTSQPITDTHQPSKSSFSAQSSKSGLDCQLSTSTEANNTSSGFTNGYNKCPSELVNSKHKQYLETDLQPIGARKDRDKKSKGTQSFEAQASHIGTESVEGKGSCRCDRKVYDYKNLLSANRDKGSLKWIDEDLQTFEDSVEDPFRVKDVDFNEGFGINALIDGIDVPFIDLSDNGEDQISRYGSVGRFDVIQYSGRCEDTGFTDSVKDTDRNLDCACNYDLRKDSRVRNGVDNLGRHCDRRVRNGVENDGSLCGRRTMKHYGGCGLADSPGSSMGTSLEVLLQTGQSSLSGESESDEPKTSFPNFSNTLDEFESFRSRSDSTEDSSWEADDEFECDCGACSLLEPRQEVDYDEWDFTQPQPQEERIFSVGEDLLDLESLLGFTDSDGDSHVLSVRLGRPVSASLEFIDTSLRQMRMIQAVVEQMLTLQPDLLSSPATPAAPETVIDSLPVVTLATDTLEQHPSCPICLSPCESGDRMSQLPCQHVFHPACARAWLLKSGTCPVCRQKVVQ